jgi:hypothetical protein
MGRPRKQTREPFWRAARKCWYVNLGARQVRLAPDRDEAWRLWHEMMARPQEARGPSAPARDNGSSHHALRRPTRMSAPSPVGFIALAYRPAE